MTLPAGVAEPSASATIRVASLGGDLMADGEPPPPSATEAFTEAFGEESRQEAFRGWMVEVRDTELWWVGVLLSLLGSMLATMGLNLQRYSHRVEAAKRLDERLPYYRQKPWIGAVPHWRSHCVSACLPRERVFSVRSRRSPPPVRDFAVGFVLVVIDAILDVLSFGFADLSLVAALGATSLLFNAVIATRFLQEQMSRRDTIGTCLVFAGTTTSVIFANRKTPAYTVDELVRNLLEPTFFIWFSFIMVALIAGAVTIRKLKRQAIERHPELSQVGRQQSTSLDDAEAAAAAALATSSELDTPRTQLHRSELLEFLRNYHAVLYAGCAGLAGGQAVSFAKAAVEIVKSAALGGTDEFVSGPGPWLIILATVVMVGVQFHFLNEGLRLFDALSIIPVYQAAWIFCGVMGGFIYLGEAGVADGEDARTTWQLALFVCGGLLTIAGVSLLIKHQPGPTSNGLLHASLESGGNATGTAMAGTGAGAGAAGARDGAHAGGAGAAAAAGGSKPFDLMGDTFPIRQSTDDPGSNTVAPGLFTLSRQSLEHMSSHDEATLEEAMVFARHELASLRQVNDSLRSDAAWRTEVLERVEADLAAALAGRGNQSLRPSSDDDLHNAAIAAAATAAAKDSASFNALKDAEALDFDLVPDSAAHVAAAAAEEEEEAAAAAAVAGARP